MNVYIAMELVQSLIWTSHDRDRDVYCILGCGVLQVDRRLPTVRRTRLPPSSGQMITPESSNFQESFSTNSGTGICLEPTP